MDITALSSNRYVQGAFLLYNFVPSFGYYLNILPLVAARKTHQGRCFDRETPRPPHPEDSGLRFVSERYEPAGDCGGVGPS